MSSCWKTGARRPAEVALDAACYRAPERTAGGPATTAAAVYCAWAAADRDAHRPARRSAATTRAPWRRRTSVRRSPRFRRSARCCMSPALDELIQRATARDPAQRPADAAALGPGAGRAAPRYERRYAPACAPAGAAARPARADQSLDRPDGRAARAPRSGPIPARAPSRRLSRRARAYAGQSRRRSITGIVDSSGHAVRICRLSATMALAWRWISSPTSSCRARARSAGAARSGDRVAELAHRRRRRGRPGAGCHRRARRGAELTRGTWAERAGDRAAAEYHACARSSMGHRWSTLCPGCMFARDRRSAMSKAGPRPIS